MLYTYNAKILKVIDGDTIDVQIDLGFDTWIMRERIQLSGVTAPKTRTTDRVEKKFGKYTESVVKKLLPVGSVHTLKVNTYSTALPFARAFGDFYITHPKSQKSVLLTEYLLEEKLVVQFRPDDRDQMTEDFLNARSHLVSEGLVDG